jgi:hypothetical protein
VAAPDPAPLPPLAPLRRLLVVLLLALLAAAAWWLGARGR